MTWIQSFTITACILLLQQSILVNAAPLDEPRALLKRGSSLTGKFLHITGNYFTTLKYIHYYLHRAFFVFADIHIDPNYLEGADPNSYCHKHGKKRSKQAGKYGALGTQCDSPVPLVKATFDFLKKEIQDIDFIIYTGDTARHVSSKLI
jgi:hypothetical protein